MCGKQQGQMAVITITMKPNTQDGNGNKLDANYTHWSLALRNMTHKIEEIVIFSKQSMTNQAARMKSNNILLEFT